MKIEVSFEGKKGVIANINGHIVKTDQSVKDGGDNSAPSPFELFLAAMSTCAGIYVKGFCDNRSIPTDKIKLIQSMEYNPATSLVSKINIEIQVPADFPEKYYEALIAVAGKCKVKQQMLNPPEVSVTTKVS